MSFTDCILSKVGDGLTKKQANEILREYDSLVEKYAKSMGDAEAGAKAASQLMHSKTAKAKEKNRSDLMAVNAQFRVMARVNKNFFEANKEYQSLSKRQRKALDLTGGKPSKSEFVRNELDAVGNAQQKVINELLAPLVPVLKKKPWLLDQMGSKAKEFNSTFKEAVGHLLGKKSKNADAASWAEALKKSFDLGNSKFKLNGGLIGYQDNYYPQAQNSLILRNMAKKKGDEVAFNEWYRFHKDEVLDMEKMIDNDTGLPFTDEKFSEVMRDVFETIKTDGLNKVHAIGMEGGYIPPKGGDLNTRRERSRFFHYKDADSFFKANERYGYGNDNLFDMMVSQISTLGRDIGTMEKFGPKPMTVMSNLNLNTSGDSMQSRSWTNAMFNTMSGALSAGGNEPNWYRAYNGLKMNIRGATLGSATIPAVASDMFFGRMAARRFRLPGYKLMENLSRITKAGGVNADELAVFNVQSDYLLGASVNRFGDEPVDKLHSAANLMETAGMKSSEFTHRASLLNWWTARMETAAAMSAEGSAYLSRNIKFKELPKPMRDLMALHELGEAEWDIIRSTPPKHVQGGKFIGPEDIAQSVTDPEVIDPAMKRRTAERYGDYIQHIRDAAVNKPTGRVRGIQTMGTEAGTIGRAFWSSATMFKGFGLSLMFNQFLPYLHKAIKTGNPSDLLLLVIPGSIMGASAIQLRELAKGNDPRDMSNAKFWVASALQGGAFGPIGDFMFADYGRFGRDPIVDAVTGPMIGIGSDITRIFMGNFNRAIDDSEYEYLDRFLADTAKFLTYQVPGQNLWYARQLIRQGLEYPLSLIDEDYEQKKQAAEDYQIENFGNGKYWQHWLPSRAPDLGSAWQ